MIRIDGIHFQTGKRISLTLEDERITGMVTKPDDPAESLPFIGPGLVELQINGYCGLDFNTLPITEDIVRRVTQGLWQEGVTSYFPTIITNSEEAIEHAVNTIAAACSNHDVLEKAIAGIHLEGPFISPEDGPRGAHCRAFVRKPDWSLFQRWQEAAGGRIKIVTLSPEWPSCCEFIARCTESGVMVSIGHTAATPEQIREAVAAGARLSTHLGNGAHLLLPRHPNYIWEQLAQDDLWTCIIADGFHLPESFLKVVLKVKGDKAILVSDAVGFSGMAPGEYESHIGGRVVLTPEGKLHLAENPNLLAGSAQMLTRGIGHLVRSGLSSFSEAWEMASVRPARLLDLPVKNGLMAGAPADLVVFRRGDTGLTVLQTFKAGKLVYDADESNGR
jgi:N-acetylglucosamine-6-phosphate deacetylase